MNKAALLVLSSLLMASPVAAQSPASGAAGATASAASQVVAGATAFDTAGAEVGKIETVADGLAVVFTGTNRVSLPLTSFGTGAKGPVLAMTKAELDAAAQASAASRTDRLNTLLVAGTQVVGRAGLTVGTIKDVDAGFVTLETPDGAVKLPRHAFGLQGDGILLSMTAEELRTAIKGTPAS